MDKAERLRVELVELEGLVSGLYPEEESAQPVRDALAVALKSAGRFEAKRSGAWWQVDEGAYVSVSVKTHSNYDENNKRRGDVVGSVEGEVRGTGEQSGREVRWTHLGIRHHFGPEERTFVYLSGSDGFSDKARDVMGAAVSEVIEAAGVDWVALVVEAQHAQRRREVLSALREAARALESAVRAAAPCEFASVLVVA